MSRQTECHVILRENIGAALGRRGWSQAEAARQCGMSLTMFNQRYHGHMEFRVVELVKLAGALEIPVSELTAGLEDAREYANPNQKTER